MGYGPHQGQTEIGESIILTYFQQGEILSKSDQEVQWCTDIALFPVTTKKCSKSIQGTKSIRTHLVHLKKNQTFKSSKRDLMSGS